jgi:hypothetical protein
MLSKHAHYFDHAQDSLAYHLRYQSIVNSTFLDNTEEYEMLKSAGLMRLIESDSLVVELQSKNSIHDMYKEVEADISRINQEIERCTANSLTCLWSTDAAATSTTGNTSLRIL